MTKDQKNEVIEVLKSKFSQYSNFYITDTENLSVEAVNKLRGHCFDKHVEMKVAKNTLIKKALESLDSAKYNGIYDSLHKVTALLFSESPKEPALIISSFRKSNKGEKPALKAAFISGDVYVGDDQLAVLTRIKTRNELIGDVIGLLQSPAKRVIAALLQNAEKKAETAEVKGVTAEVKGVTAEVKGVTAEAKGVTAEPTEVTAEAKGVTAEAKEETPEPKGETPEPKGETPEAGS